MSEKFICGCDGIGEIDLSYMAWKIKTDGRKLVFEVENPDTGKIERYELKKVKAVRS